MTGLGHSHGGRREEDGRGACARRCAQCRGPWRKKNAPPVRGTKGARGENRVAESDGSGRDHSKPFESARPEVLPIKFGLIPVSVDHTSVAKVIGA